jgi:hypothetical protein
MATTTNYGWDTPDDTDLVKDGAAAIRTLGSSIDTTTKNLNPQTTTGALAYRSATANVNTALPIGSTGQVLTVAAGVPTWAAPAGGGKVLQVIYGTSTTETTNSTSTYADTTLSATITPASASNKVLILVAQNVQLSAGAANVSIGMRILRASTEIFAQNDPIYTGSTQSVRWNFGANYLDSPSTTSATTYKTQAKVTSGAASDVVTQISSNASTIILLEIGA